MAKAKKTRAKGAVRKKTRATAKKTARRTAAAKSAAKKKPTVKSARKKAAKKKPAVQHRSSASGTRPAQPAVEPRAPETPRPVAIPGAWPFPMGNRT
jgi:hypothetical protein